ncbi:ABC transporter permease [Paenibacillus polymyxa]|uniref:ABC transporter permease n=1 Tax=Paenibacillus polymyxa TaxID=1406 RepID=UPI00321683CD
MIRFLHRNLQIYYRDKATVFISLIGTLMIFVLYILFLGDLWEHTFDDIKNVRHLIDSWVMASIISVVSVTATLGNLGIMVNDKSTQRIKDFYSSPVKRSDIAGGYILSATVVGLIMSMIMLVLAEIYIVLMGGPLLSVGALLRLTGLIVLVSLSNTSTMLFFASFFTSHNAYTSAAGMIASFIGFIAGAYIPIGLLPKYIQWIVEPLPLFQGAALLRQSMIYGMFDSSFIGMSQQKIMEFNNTFGITTQIGKYQVSPILSLIILVASIAIFFFLSVWNLSKKNQ